MMAFYGINHIMPNIYLYLWRIVMSEKNSTVFSQKNINIADLVFVSIKRWYIIALVVVVSLILTALYTLSFVTPLYTSSAKIFVLSRQTENYYTSADFNISTYLSNDIADIIVDTPVLSGVYEETDKKYSINYLKSAVSVSKPKDTRIIEIKVSTPKAEDSKIIVDSICENAKEKLVEIMKLDSVEIIKKGTLPQKPSSPNLANSLISVGIIAFIIAEAIIVINYIFNNKVSSVTDIEKCLGLNVLATIPYNPTKNKVK